MAIDSEGAMTKPTIETVLRRINSLGESLQAQLNSLHADVGILKSDVAVLKSDVAVLKSDVAVLKSDVSGIQSELSSFRNEFKLHRAEMTVRIDRIDGMANQTRAEMLNLRADYSEWKDRIEGSRS